MIDVTSSIIAYEEGELDEDETIALFQKLVDSGLCWTLQGHYGRTAVDLLEQGLLVNTPEATERALAIRAQRGW